MSFGKASHVRPVPFFPKLAALPADRRSTGSSRSGGRCSSWRGGRGVRAARRSVDATTRQPETTWQYRPSRDGEVRRQRYELPELPELPGDWGWPGSSPVVAAGCPHPPRPPLPLCGRGKTRLLAVIYQDEAGSRDGNAGTRPSALQPSLSLAERERCAALPASPFVSGAAMCVAERRCTCRVNAMQAAVARLIRAMLRRSTPTQRARYRTQLIHSRKSTNSPVERLPCFQKTIPACEAP